MFTVLVGAASSDITLYRPRHKHIVQPPVNVSFQPDQLDKRSFTGYPEQAGEPAVLRRIVQMEVVVEVALQRLLFFLVANTTEQHGPACRAHRHGEARARRGLVPRGAHPRPGPLLWRTEKKTKVGPNKYHFPLFLTCINCVSNFFFVPWPSLPSRFRRNMSE